MANDFKSLRREVEALISDMLSPEAQRQYFVALAEDEVAAFQQLWREALARQDFEAQIFLDGGLTRSIKEATFPGSVIVARAKPLQDATDLTLKYLDALVKIRSGRYKRSLAVYANQRRVKSGAETTPSDKVAITYLAPYARPAEREEFNIKDGAALGGGLLFTVAKLVKRDMAGAPIKVEKNFRNFADAEIEPRRYKEVAREFRHRGGKGKPPELNRLPAILIG